MPAKKSGISWPTEYGALVSAAAAAMHPASLAGVDAGSTASTVRRMIHTAIAACATMVSHGLALKRVAKMNQP